MMRLVAIYGFVLISAQSAWAAGAGAVFWTASDPFVGKWKFDVDRSRIVDDMHVEALGGNKFAFNFEGAPTETVVADGTDQPGVPGTTLAVRAVDAHHLTVIRKRDGRVTVSAVWKLAPNGRTLRDDFTNLQPDGSKTTTHYLYRRLAGTSGLAGAWESTTPPVGLDFRLGIEPYEGKGLTFASPGSNKNLLFDGSDHAGARKGATYSGHRRGARSIQYAERNHGKLDRVRLFEISPDGMTLRETIRVAGRRTPDLFVFERE